jgi:tRNA-modifying protein YgfZ
MTVTLERSFLRAFGPDAVEYLQSMLTNDVESLAHGEGCYALLLTPKARVIADLEVLRVGDDLLLGCPPAVVDQVRDSLVRARFRKKVQFEPAPCVLVWGDHPDAVASLDSPAGPLRLLPRPVDESGATFEWEVARVESGMPRFGIDFGPESMPAEAGVVERAVSFTKGCYPGQEPVARLRYRGHPNRQLRGLAFAGAAPPTGSPVIGRGRELGTLTSVAESARYGPIGLAVLRREAEVGEAVEVDGVQASVRSLPFGRD